jgi:hypothetical protein
MKVSRFWLQPTETYPEGAPQREEYENDIAHFVACKAYAVEWRARYECRGCVDPACPQCSQRDFGNTSVT